MPAAVGEEKAADKARTTRRARRSMQARQKDSKADGAQAAAQVDDQDDIWASQEAVMAHLFHDPAVREAKQREEKVAPQGPEMGQ